MLYFTLGLLMLCFTLGLSCRDILFWSPACRGANGLYWVHNSTSSADQQVWCDMDTMGGGWERVVDFHASTFVPVCPFFLSAHSHNGTFLCSNNGGVVEVKFRVAGEVFSEFRGSVSAFADGEFHGFFPGLSAERSRNMSGHFLDGVSVLLEEETSPHLRHIHSFTVGNYENTEDLFMKQATCPGYGAASPNSVIGRHYTCTLLKSDNQLSRSDPLPLWEMSSVYCVSDSRMCTRPSEWFYRHTGKDYRSDSTEVVVKFMSESPAYIALKHFTLYVR